MNTFSTEWQSFRATVLRDLTDDEAELARDIFYSGALATFDLLVLSDSSVGERLKTIVELRRELVQFMSELCTAAAPKPH